MTEPEEKRDWIFTFGFGHTDEHGRSRANNYAVINGTFSGARKQMIERYGLKWSFQYDTKDDAGVDEWKLTEI